MKTINYPDSTSSLSFDAFDSPHGALLPYPLILLDLDSLPTPNRIDQTMPVLANLDVLIDPYSGFTTEWRACTPGSHIVVAVAARASYQWGTIYVQSSADGATRADTMGIGDLNASQEVGFGFSTTQPFYRITVCSAVPGRVSLWTQQRN